MPQSFLSFFKIINIFYDDKTISQKRKKPQNQLIEGLRDLLPCIADNLAKKRIKELQKSERDIPAYLYKRRCSIAHAFIDPVIGPDNVIESRDIFKDVWIIRGVADYLIENRLGVLRSITTDKKLGKG